MRLAACLVFVVFVVCFCDAVARRPPDASEPAVVALASNSTNATIPSNDVCSNAFQLSRTGGIVRGTTVGATNSSIVTVECADERTNEVGGVWFSIRPRLGGRIVASLCDGTEFTTELVVFKDGCDLQTCVWSDIEGCGGQSILTWTAEGDEYLIYVSGAPGSAVNVGEFTLSVNVTGTEPVNDLCSNAVPIPSTGGKVPGSILYATYRSLRTTVCRANAIGEVGGVWYTITPVAGTKVTASLCDNADFETRLAILTGGCDAQTCVASDQHSCYYENASTVTWVPDGNEYLIYVTGASGYTGNFNLTVSIEGTPAANDFCSDATQIPATGGVMKGNTGYATSETLITTTCNGVVLDTRGGVWYTITPPVGTAVLATTCENSFFDTELALFSGGCNVQTCVAANDNGCDVDQSVRSVNGYGSSVAWTADGSPYLLYVTGNGSAGNFQLTVVITPPDAIE